MATRTDNLGLIKPALDDNIDVTQLNANSDIIDSKIQTNIENIESVKQELPKYLPLTGGTISGKLNVTSGLTVSNNVAVNSSVQAGSIITNTLTNSGSTLNLWSNNAVITTDSNRLELYKDGNLVVGKQNQNVIIKPWDAQYIRMQNGDTAIECNSDGSIYLSANNLRMTTGSEFRLLSPNGATNLAVNNDGYTYLNGSQIWNDNFNAKTEQTSSAYIDWRWWDLNKYTRILICRYYNNANWVSQAWVNFPVPFLNTGYNVSVTMRRHNDTDAIRVNGDVRNTVYGCTTTGMGIGIDNEVDTCFFIIGRIA